MRYTEYHAGVAVIKKNQTKGAAAKLAKIEDMDRIPEICCDEYCKYPARCRSQEEDGPDLRRVQAGRVVRDTGG